MPFVQHLNKPGGKHTYPDGHGMDVTLINQLLAKISKGINVFVRVDDQQENERYGQWLDVLEKSQHFPTKSGKIRIYPLDAYIKGDPAIRVALKSRP